MRILVTGSQGFTGRHFIRRALSQGYEIVEFQSKLQDLTSIKQEVESLEFSHVAHFAAISFVGHENPLAFYETNVMGTLNLLDALIHRQGPRPRVLLASSANVYGNALSSPVEESAPLAPVNHYAMSKVAMESMARNCSDRLDIIFSRPFNYTGPGQSDNFLVPKIVRHFRERRPRIALGNLDVIREFNDVRMVCDATLALLTHGVSGETYNICTGQGYRLTDLLEQLSRLTGHTMEVEVNPAFIRANEIKSLLGSPLKLRHCIPSLQSPTLNETLDWMLGDPNHGE